MAAQIRQHHQKSHASLFLNRSQSIAQQPQLLLCRQLISLQIVYRTKLKTSVSTMLEESSSTEPPCPSPIPTDAARSSPSPMPSQFSASVARPQRSRNPPKK